MVNLVSTTSLKLRSEFKKGWCVGEGGALLCVCARVCEGKWFSKC